MNFKQVLDRIDYQHISGPPPEAIEVCSVTADSRLAEEGVLFTAVRGLSADGHDFASDAAEKGCSGIIVEKNIDLARYRDCSVVKVADSRAAIALCASALFGHPGEKMPLIGITGTNGKTTVSWIVADMLEENGMNVGLIGTVGIRTRKNMEPKFLQHTTPSAEILQKILGDLHERTDLTIMEVSSHSLDQERILGCRFKVAAFTGLSRDHLDYHSGMEDYFQSKIRLFKEHLADDSVAVINVDDSYGRRLADELEEAGRKLILCSLKKSGDIPAYMEAGMRQYESAGFLNVLSANMSISGLDAAIQLPDDSSCMVKSPLIGEHNLSNITIAAGIAYAFGLDAGQIGAGLSACNGVPGRLEKISDPLGCGQESRHLFVDYAHTDDALSRVIDLLHSVKPPGSIIIAVAGCGGDRDRGKRPLMGKALAKADLAIVTSDNPRTEEPASIAQDMVSGIDTSNFIVELDRKAAIELAAGMARNKDIVLVAGKGHETVQTGLETIPFDDRKVSRKALHVSPGTHFSRLMELVEIKNSSL